MSLLIIAGSVLVVGLSTIVVRVALKKNHFNPIGKHCYIGGGSEGLGLALAIQLVEKGAHVTILSRSQLKLDLAMKELEQVRLNDQQLLQSYSVDLTDSIHATKVYTQAILAHKNLPPNYIFTCAGGCIPTLFEQMNVESHWNCMEWNFKTVLCTIHDGIQHMIKHSVRGQKEKSKIILTGSVLSMMGIVGYSSYSPSKFAIRGLAESLRNELLLHDISVHLFLPATIYSPGFEKEQLLKPEITKLVEGPDEGLDCKGVATNLIKGLERNEFYITYEPVGNMLRNSRGITPRNDLFFDTLWAIAGTIALPIWRWMSADGEVHKEAKRLAGLKK